MKENTQCQCILNALRQGEEITPRDAIERWNCYRLGARIWDLKQAGIPVDVEMIKHGKSYFACYSLKSEHRNLEPDFQRRGVSLPCKHSDKVFIRDLPQRNAQGEFSGEQTVNDDIIGKAKELYEQGKSYREIGAILGYPWPTIYKRLRPLREAGILKSRPPGHPRQLTFNTLGGN
jgi:DNA-binding transcriptional ArsR family regulator